MPRVQRLRPTVIDEVSSVDRDANGYAKIMISKRDDGEGTQMPHIDAEDERTIDLADMNFGDTVEIDGEEYTLATAEDVEKMIGDGLISADEVYSIDEDEGEGEDDNDGEPAARENERELVGVGKQRGAQSLVSKAQSRSLGETVLGQLSKALNDSERDEIFSKAIDVLTTRVTAAESRATRAEAVSKRLANEAELSQFATISDELGVPADPQAFAGILQKVSKVLSGSELDTFERVLSAAGEAAALTEIGSRGAGRPSLVMDAVGDAAEAAISKSGGPAITKEQAMVAMLEANPELYDEYMDEQG